MNTVGLFIDGREITAAAGQTVLEAALAANIYIPHLCTHPDLPVQGNCNLCVVELDGGQRTVKACETPVFGGMRVTTKSRELAKARNVAMELMLAGHPKDCTSCKTYLNCELQSLMQYLGTLNARMRHIQREAININTKNPLIIRELERCVQCGRCVRACRDLRGVGVLGYRAVRLGRPIDLGKTTNIIGGGNVAYDCARTLLRMGKSVNIVCLEKGDAMLADREEIVEATEEGACLYDGATSISIETEGGKITGHRIIDAESFYFDENRKLVVETVNDSERVIPCDSIVFAAGQETGLDGGFGIELNRFGYPAVDADKLTTSIDGVFAAGDVITGTKFVIDAIAGGRKAATVIDRYLGKNGEIDETLTLHEAGEPKIGEAKEFAQKPREAMTLRPSESRKTDFKPVSEGLTCVQAACEAGRCLQCDLRKQITGVRLWTEYAVKGM